MAPIKFEDHIKEQFDKRTIKPTVGAWDKLASNLDEAEEKVEPKQNRFLVWIAAASIIAILGTIWFTVSDQNAAPINEVQMVAEEDKKQQEESSSIPVQVNPEVLEQKYQIEVVETKLEEQIKKETQKFTPQAPEKKALAVVEPNQELKDEVVVQKTELKQVEDQAIALKIDEVVKKVDRLMAHKTVEVTENEIDSLLKIAEKELFAERYLNQKKVVVDADDLLREVENDLSKEKLLKDHIFETLKSGYLKARTVIVNREQ